MTLVDVVSSIVPTSNHNGDSAFISCNVVVSSIVPTSNHNHFRSRIGCVVVVSSIVPTSNHNDWYSLHYSSQLYLLLFLHQTTTHISLMSVLPCCIFYCSYIKPQLSSGVGLHDGRCIFYCSYIKPQQPAQTRHPPLRCIFYCSYIKPQRRSKDYGKSGVVSSIVPTSNHNYLGGILAPFTLYLLLFLHQTTTLGLDGRLCLALYLLLFLHQTTTGDLHRLQVLPLYLLLFLHQTTTIEQMASLYMCCIFYCSYIKPQP